MELEGRKALVIGGGSIRPGIGIGRAIALTYARAGARVAVADVDAAAAAATVRMIQDTGGAASAIGLDVTDDGSIQRGIAQALAWLGGIDLLHNNVGLGKAGDAADTSPADWRRIQDANVTALHVSAQAVLPTMTAQRSGVILTTSSIAALRHLGYSHLAYATTKAAAIHFTRMLAIDYARFGIRANSIVAGLIDTPRIAVTLQAAYDAKGAGDMRARRAAAVPLGRMGSAQDVAEAALFLASDRAAFITGTELVVDGGLSATVQH
ncbi:MAG: SDR family oxidoreductase [Geminicoccaceae bacterium]|nr:MAG: SDR family oxidoreductase [Geminicoccaceae bacterium]